MAKVASLSWRNNKWEAIASITPQAHVAQMH